MIVVQPIPVEGRDNFRSGAAQGCQRILAGLESVEDYSRELSRSLPPFEIRDNLAPGEGSALEAIRDCAEKLYSGAARVLFVGGDHGITPPLVEAAYAQWPDLAVIHFDAHLDRRTTHEGVRASHATVCERLENREYPIPVYSFGIRAHGQMEQIPFPDRIFYGSKIVAPLVDVLRGLGNRPLYLSLDMDVLDPALFGAVSNPEPGGVPWLELVAALQWLDGRLVAADLVEYVPVDAPRSPHDCMAAALLKLMLIVLAGYLPT